MAEPDPHRRPLQLANAIVALAVGLLPRPVHAEAAEWGVSLGPAVSGFATAPTGTEPAALDLYWGLAARVRYGLDDFWQLGASADLGVASGPSLAGSVLAELHYIIDALTWVPSVHVGLGPAWRGTATDLALAFGASLDYRSARAYAVGISGRYTLLLTDLAHTDGAFQTALGLTLFFE